MTGRELVRRTIKFQSPGKLACNFPGCDDMDWVLMTPHIDGHVDHGPDEWGCIWDKVGDMNKGQVIVSPLKDLDDFENCPKPDIHEPRRWANLKARREASKDRYILALGISLYERLHYLHGQEETWMSIHENPDGIKRVVDYLLEMNLAAVKYFAAGGMDGYLVLDDWGLQDRLMISPQSWRDIWKPRYARLFKAVHDAGMETFLHSCGRIVDILDDLIEAGLDVIQMDQQLNNGLETLRDRFRGRITFYSPPDIQKIMTLSDTSAIRAYCRDMVNMLGTERGGLIATQYGDPVGAGHSPQAVAAMRDEFIKIREGR